MPFEAAHVDDAARLLAMRHRADRKVSPALPERFERPEDACRVLKALLDKGNVTGVVALRGSQLVGYLIGAKVDNPTRGRHVWVDYAGSAVGERESGELYRDLYAVGAREWVQQGFFRHYAVVPSGDPALADAWFRLGFGHEQVHGLLALSAVDPVASSPAGVVIRLAQASDEEAVRSIATTIWECQVQAPTWAVGLPEEWPRLRDGYAELLRDDKVQFWLAVRDREILGYQVFWPNEVAAEDLLTPGCSISLGVGATVPLARGMGIGTALVQHGLAQAALDGHLHCTADWRMTNLLSSRFWPQRGFRPVAYRLFRQVDPRIAWANG